MPKQVCGHLPFILSMYLQPVFQSCFGSQEIRGPRDGVGFVAYRVYSMGWGFWSSQHARSLPNDCLENLRQVRERPGVFPWYGEPREWGVPPGGCSLTP